MLAILGRSWASTGGPRPLLGPLRAVLDPSWGLSWRSRSWGLSWWSAAALGACVGGLGPKNAKNMATLKMCLFFERERKLRPRERSWAVLGPLCWRSWAALGAYVGDLGPLLGSMLAVLGRLGAYAGGLGGDQAEKWPRPEREGDPGKDRGPLATSRLRGLPRFFSIDVCVHP